MQQQQEQGVLWRVQQQLVPLEWLAASREGGRGTGVWISMHLGELGLQFLASLRSYFLPFPSIVSFPSLFFHPSILLCMGSKLVQP
jgi:hypothetical protein